MRLEEGTVRGDINACAGVIDHCEGPQTVTQGQAGGMKGNEGFWKRAAEDGFALDRSIE